MKKSKIIKFIPLLSLALFLASCNGGAATTTTTSTPTPSTGPSVTSSSSEEPITEEHDYVKDLKFDLNSARKKKEVTVKQFIDGDTTHFNIDSSEISDGVLKARYIAINTPESTGKIEPWGKKASKFTKSKLSAATSIYVESDTATWDADSTGSRYVVWVWYKTADDAEYKNLNLEILQNGLALASNTGGNSYGDICMKALNQAKALKYNLYSDEQDPDFYYGNAKPVSLTELRMNIDEYENTKVAFTANVVGDYNNGVYLEEYSPELDMYVGMYAYYGASAPGYGLEILKTGNRIMCVGLPQYYEAGKSWQVSGLAFANPFIPATDDVTTLVEENHPAAYQEVTIEKFNSKVLYVYEEEKADGTIVEHEDEYDFAMLALNSSISMKNLKVKRIYTTDNGGNSDGAMTLTCEVDGQEITVRTAVLYDANGNKITSDRFEGKTINVKGFVNTYNDKYQIQVISLDGITILN